jgi:hypothetical protein
MQLGADGKTVAGLPITPYRVLGTPAEPAFDVFIDLVRSSLGVSSAILAFFDGSAMVIKAVAGTPQSDPVIAAGLLETYERERTQITSDEALFFCSTPVYAADGAAVGVIGGFDARPHPTLNGAATALETISFAVTLALEARRRTYGAPIAPPPALVAFDAADWSLMFASAASTRPRGWSDGQLQTLHVDDYFNGISAEARSKLDVLREGGAREPFAFAARALGAGGFWYPVACSARAILDKRLRTVVVVEYAPPAPLSPPPDIGTLRPVPSTHAEHSIDAVLTKIEAGRRALRHGRGAYEPLDTKAFLSSAKQLLGDNREPHVLAVFKTPQGEAGDVIERARRVRLLCDHDLVTVIEGRFVALLLRDMPVRIGRQAVRRFARSVPACTFVVRDMHAPNAGEREILDGAIAELRHPF